MPGDNAAKCFAAEHAFTSGFPRPRVFQIITNQLQKQTGRRERDTQSLLTLNTGVPLKRHNILPRPQDENP